MIRPSLDEWVFQLIRLYSQRGTCARRQAGAVALDQYNRIVGLGMNGVPKGMTHCTDIPCLGATDEPGNTTNCLAIHAETNMLINSYDTMKIVKVYITTSPCLPCALMLANLPNLKVVKALTRYADERGIEILEIANVTVEIEKEKEPREV